MSLLETCLHAGISFLILHYQQAKFYLSPPSGCENSKLNPIQCTLNFVSSLSLAPVVFLNFFFFQFKHICNMTYFASNLDLQMSRSRALHVRQPFFMVVLMHSVKCWLFLLKNKRRSWGEEKSLPIRLHLLNHLFQSHWLLFTKGACRSSVFEVQSKSTWFKLSFGKSSYIENFTSNSILFNRFETSILEHEIKTWN